MVTKLGFDDKFLDAMNDWELNDERNCMKTKQLKKEQNQKRSEM